MRRRRSALFAFAATLAVTGCGATVTEVGDGGGQDAGADGKAPDGGGSGDAGPADGGASDGGLPPRDSGGIQPVYGSPPVSDGGAMPVYGAAPPPNEA